MPRLDDPGLFVCDVHDGRGRTISGVTRDQAEAVEFTSDTLAGMPSGATALIRKAWPDPSGGATYTYGPTVWERRTRANGEAPIPGETRSGGTDGGSPDAW
ncbi:hypothetical protein [Thermocatellispora tengchongensis]